MNDAGSGLQRIDVRRRPFDKKRSRDGKRHHLVNQKSVAEGFSLSR